MDRPTPPEETMEAAKVVQLPKPSPDQFIGTYILQDGKPMPIRDSFAWANWMEKHRFTETVQHDWHCGVMISTVFLGLDHNYGPNGMPILWETILFARTRKSRQCFNQTFQCRYTSQQDADNMHQHIIKLFKSGYSVSWIKKRLEEL